jgi:hypothetical protein
VETSSIAVPLLRTTVESQGVGMAESENEITPEIEEALVRRVTALRMANQLSEILKPDRFFIEDGQAFVKMSQKEMIAYTEDVINNTVNAYRAMIARRN